MENLIFTYTDSEAGKQTEQFAKLSEIISYLENFNPNGDSEGVVYQNNEPIFEYKSENNLLSYRKSD